MSARTDIGGRKLGRIARIVYEEGLGTRREKGLGESEATWTLSRLVSALGGVCSAVQDVTAGRFDRRRNKAAAHSVRFAQRIAPLGLFEKYEGKVASK